MMVGILLPNDIAGDNVSPHVVGTKGPVVHLANLIQILDSDDLPAGVGESYDQCSFYQDTQFQ